MREGAPHQEFFVDNPPIQHIAERAEADHQNARVRAGLQPEARDDECDEDGLCSQEGLDAVDGARTMGALNTASLIVALVASGAGLTLVLTAPDDDDVAVAPVIGPGFVGVAGRF